MPHHWQYVDELRQYCHWWQYSYERRLTAMNAIILLIVVAALVAVAIAMARWVRSDADPRQRPLPRPQDAWSDLPTGPYATC